MCRLNPFLLLGFFSILLTTINASDQKILPYPISQYELANGLNVVTVPFDSPGLASFYIVVRVGSRNEVESGVTGFAHFFEHMMFRGTDKYPREEYNSVLKMTGAGANANTSLDRTRPSAPKVPGPMCHAKASSATCCRLLRAPRSAPSTGW